jgi:hypothetical protein
VSNVIGLDFGAILKFTEKIFNLGNIPPGDKADSYAYDDLGEFFKFSNPPRIFQSIQAPLKPDYFFSPERPRDEPDNDWED